MKATPEDLYRVPENGKAEIVGGEVVLMSPTGAIPGRSGGRIYRSLDDYGYIQVKTGTRGTQTPAGQGLLTGRTLVGYVEAESGRELVISIMVGGVSTSSLEDLLPTFETVAEDQGELAVAIQQGY